MNKNMFNNLDKLNNLDDDNNINNNGLVDGNGTIESLDEVKEETFGMPEFNKVPSPDFNYNTSNNNKNQFADLLKGTKEASENSKSKEEGKGFFQPKENVNKPMSAEERTKLEDTIKTLERKLSKQNGVKRKTLSGIIFGMIVIFFLVIVFGIMPYYEKYIEENKNLSNKVYDLEERVKMYDAQMEYYKSRNCY